MKSTIVKCIFLFGSLYFFAFLRQVQCHIGLAEVGVDVDCCRYVGVAHEYLRLADIHSSFRKLCAVVVPEAVGDEVGRERVSSIISKK